MCRTISAEFKRAAGSELATGEEGVEPTRKSGGTLPVQGKEVSEGAVVALAIPGIQ